MFPNKLSDFKSINYPEHIASSVFKAWPTCPPFSFFSLSHPSPTPPSICDLIGRVIRESLVEILETFSCDKKEMHTAALFKSVLPPGAPASFHWVLSKSVRWRLSKERSVQSEMKAG